jgi:soluble lytic murein transglycosylase-like protein
MFHRTRFLLHRCRQAGAAGSRALVAALAALLPAAAAQAQAQAAIFQIDDTPGEIHLSDRADADAGVVVRRVAGTPAESPRTPAGPAARDHFADIVRSAAAAERLQPALIDAVIAVESAYRVRAVSSRGASGLMQLMPDTARLYGVTDIFDPRQNITAGARHLRGLLDRYGQDLARALAAYNAGAGAIDRAALRGAGWPGETAAYVPNVLGRVATRGSPPAP